MVIRIITCYHQFGSIRFWWIQNHFSNWLIVHLGLSTSAPAFVSRWGGSVRERHLALYNAEFYKGSKSYGRSWVYLFHLLSSSWGFESLPSTHPPPKDAFKQTMRCSRVMSQKMPSHKNNFWCLLFSPIRYKGYAFTMLSSNTWMVSIKIGLFKRVALKPEYGSLRYWHVIITGWLQRRKR